MLFDWVSLKKVQRVKMFLVFTVLVVHSFALYAALWEPERFTLPTAFAIIGWVTLPFFVLLLISSLVLELPTSNTYSKAGVSNQLVTTGTYALTRHPGVIWYTLALISLTLATGSVALLIAAPVWVFLDIVYVTVQDRYFFVRMFTEYGKYKAQTPMLIPTRVSFAACLNTMAGRFRSKRTFQKANT